MTKEIRSPYIPSRQVRGKLLRSQHRCVFGLAVRPACRGCLVEPSNGACDNHLRLLSYILLLVPQIQQLQERHGREPRRGRVDSKCLYIGCHVQSEIALCKVLQSRVFRERTGRGARNAGIAKQEVQITRVLFDEFGSLLKAFF